MKCIRPEDVYKRQSCYSHSSDRFEMEVLIMRRTIRKTFLLEGETVTMKLSLIHI